MEHGLDHLGIEWIPSVGNFISVDVGQPATPLFEEMQKQGVIVRPVGNYGMANHLRISIGLPEENLRCLQVLTKILRGQ